MAHLPISVFYIHPGAESPTRTVKPSVLGIFVRDETSDEEDK